MFTGDGISPLDSILLGFQLLLLVRYDR